ncbi:hypothetical protein [Amycolatopsis sp. NBC_00438]|uniref:hypothetical protein n=1 Tax=Amycolatopsis sp. NBC_00438 TaxID=2903558 RepID=UPI002E1E275F
MVDDEPAAQSTKEVLAAGLAALEQLLGHGWKVAQLTDERSALPSAIFDARVQVTPPDSSPYTELLVEVRSKPLSPREVLNRTVPMITVLRQAQSRVALLVISPWLSPRTQEVLRKHDIAYLDLTGNVSLAVTYPAIRIHTQGASRAPSRETSTRSVTLAGPRAGRIVRFLADYLPPYRASEIVTQANVSAPWVSRLLGQLEDQLLIQREGRDIVEVRWPELLRARADAYTLLRPGNHEQMVAPSGAKAVLDRLRNIPSLLSGSPNIAVTGSYAARTIAPHTVGGQLMLYVDHLPHVIDEWQEQLGLIRVDEHPDVLLLRAPDTAVFDRYRVVDGVTQVGYSQLVLDSLTGTGRMPAEGETILKVLSEDESWRVRLNR